MSPLIHAPSPHRETSFENPADRLIRRTLITLATIPARSRPATTGRQGRTADQLPDSRLPVRASHSISPVKGSDAARPRSEMLRAGMKGQVPSPKRHWR